jgi:predicted negative regulator of RcsB-dependent stress response
MPIFLGIVRVVPIWVWVLVAVLAWGGYQKWSATRATKAATEAVERAAAEASAREDEQKFAIAAREASNAYAKNTAAVRRAAIAARTERDKLLNDFANVQACPSATAASGVDGTAAMRAVLGSCTGTLQELAETADTDAARLKALQDFVRTTR